MLKYLAYKEQIEAARFTVLYKASLLDRSESVEVSQFNDLLKDYQKIASFNSTSKENKQLLKDMEHFDKVFGEASFSASEDKDKNISESFSGDLKTLIRE